METNNNFYNTNGMKVYSIVLNLHKIAACLKMEIKGVMLLIITLISEVVLSAVNIEDVPTYSKIYQNPLILGTTTQNLNGNFNQRQLLPIQRNKNCTQGIYPQAQHLLTNHQLLYLPDPNIKDSNYVPRNDGGVQNIHYTNLKQSIDFELPVNEFKHTLNSPRGYYLSQAGIEQRRIDTVIQPSIQYFNQEGLKNNGYNPNNENVPKVQSVKFKINPDIALPLGFINTKRNDIFLEQQQRPIVPNVKNYNQEIRNIPSATNTGNHNERNINPNQNHLIQTGFGYLTHENKLNALQMLNNQPKESRPGNNTTKKKLSTGKSDHNKRYKVIHNNGAVEYYDDFYVILKKYPHIKIANNILYSQIIQNMKFNKVHNISPVIPISTKPLVNPKIDVLKPSNILKDHADIFSQYKNEQAYQKPQKPVEEKVLIKTIVNKTPEKPFVPQLSSLKLNQNTQAQPSMLEKDKKNIASTNALAKRSENTYISGFKTEHIARPKVGNEVQLLAHRLDDVVEQPVTHTLSNNYHRKVSLLQSAPNTPSESSKSKNTTVIKNYTNQNSNITKPITISSVLNEHKNKNTTAVQLNTKTNVEKSPSFNITSGLSKNQTEYNTTLYKENIFDPIRTVNLTTPECFDENLSIKQNVTESKSKHPDNTENANSTEDSINNKDDQDKDYLPLSKPQMWLRTTDPDFWKKLIDDNDAYSFVYIFDIQSQSKVEKDTKMTIYPNGTVMEEITETIWENGDGDQPKVFKTVKVTYPDDEKKDKNT